MVLLATGVLALLVAAPGRRALAARIALEAYTQRIPDDGPHVVSYLLRVLGDRAPIHGDQLRQSVSERVSSYPGDTSGAEQLEHEMAAGRKHFIEGEYAKAAEQLARARQRVIAHQALIAVDQTLREPLHRATLFLAHALLRLGRRDRAVELISETVRSFPDRELSLVHHGPDLVRLYREVRRALQKSSRAN